MLPLARLLVALLLLAAPAAQARLDLEAVTAAQLQLDEERAGALHAAARGDVGRLLDLVKARADERPNVRYIADALITARRLHRLGVARARPELSVAAADLADLAVRTYQNPDGTFNEYDRCTWLTQDQLHRTIPWGTAFHGQSMLRTLRELREALGEKRAADWRERLRRTATWIDGNPVLDRLVFNAAIDLASLLWKIGDELDEEAFKRAGLATAHRLLDRHLEPEQGWIRGENNGVSGFYQQMGMEFIADFARASGDARLREAVFRFMDTVELFTTPTWQFAGNFGTRTPSLGPTRPGLVLEAAALGHARASARARSAIPVAWTDDLQLWRAALATPADDTPAPRPALARFPEIGGTVLRGGLWQAWFFNYDKSLWARGFSALWHASDDAWIFGTLQSLPTQVEKAKLRLDDTSDFAGFPRVRVSDGERHYNSHQRIDDLVAEDTNVSWSETLRARDGQAGGRLQARLTLGDPELVLRVELSELAGPATLDFHFAVPAPSGPERKPVPASAVVEAETAHEARVRVGAATYRFRVLEAPAGSMVEAGVAAERGLHTGNLGGLRVRVTPPPEARALVLLVACEAL